MNLTSYKRRRLRQKPNILTVEQSRELRQLAGIKSTKNITDKGLVSHLLRLKAVFFIFFFCIDSNQFIPTSKTKT